MATQCPKCRQFVEEDYVCCADVEFTWKCDKCHMRTTGFAIPYGRCFNCGGSLTLVDEDIPANAHEMQPIQEALCFELENMNMYLEMEERSTSKTQKEVFKELAEREKEHIQLIIKKYHLGLGDELIYKQMGMPEDFFEGIDFSVDDVSLTRIYDFAISVEQKTKKFFQERITKLPEGTEREFYRELAAEEDDHIALLESEKAKLSV